MALSIPTFTGHLARLNITVPDDEIIKKIYVIEGDELNRAVTEIDRGNNRATSYLRGIFSTASDATCQRLVRRGFTIPAIDILVKIGKRHGPAFAERLQRWDEADEEGDDSDYVRSAISRFGVAVPELKSVDTMSPAPTTASAEVETKPAQHRATDGQAGTPTADYRQTPTERRSGGSVAIATPRNTQTGSNRPQQQLADRDSAVDDDPKDYLSCHVYGGSAAACFSATRHLKSGMATVNIEAAETHGRGNTNWQQKTVIQLSQRELPMVLAVLLRWVPTFEGTHSNNGTNKSFKLQSQPGKIYLSVSEKDKKTRGVPILPGDAYAITTLLIRQMLRNDEFLNAETLLRLVKVQAELHLSTGTSE